MEPRFNVTCQISTMQALLWYLIDTGNRWNTAAERAYFYATYVLQRLQWYSDSDSDSDLLES